MTNTQIETQIITAIQGGRTKFSELLALLKPKADVRKLDNALRRLRNRNVIKFDKNLSSWRLLNSAPTPTTKPQVTTDTHFGILVDASGSMAHIGPRVIKAINENILAIKSASQQYKQPTFVSLFTFGEMNSGYRSDPYQSYHRFTAKFRNVPARDVADFTVFSPHGNTPLRDAISQAINDMEVGTHKENSKILLVVTDGSDNDSRHVSVAQLAKILADKKATGVWSFAFLCPKTCVQTLVLQLGIEPSNIQPWDDATLETHVTRTSIGSTQNYMKNRSVGVRSMNSGYFTTDLSQITQQDLNKLHDLSRKFKVTTVPKETDIKSFFEEKTGSPYIPGTVFYQLTKNETIGSAKQILIKRKSGKEIYGGEEAKALIGLPATNSWTDVKVKPGNHAEYDLFVQSTSSNRKLVRGTQLIYIP